LIKAIRANLFLALIAKNWPDIRVVFLVRSPYRVIGSMIEQMRSGWLFEWTPEDIARQTRLIEDWLWPFVDVLSGPKTLPERLMIRWCIENYVAAKQLQGRENVLVLGYEQLASGTGWDKLGIFLTDRRWSGSPDSGLLMRQSRTGSPAPGIGGRNLYKNLDDADVSRLGAILDRFGLRDFVPQMAASWVVH
jgi:hypothetical protein